MAVNIRHNSLRIKVCANTLETLASEFSVGQTVTNIKQNLSISSTAVKQILSTNLN